MRWLAVTTAVVLSAQCAQAATALDRIKESGVVKIGYRADAEPYSYRDAKGAPAGYVVDVCRQVAAKLGAGLRVEYVLVPATQRFEAVRDGRIDMLCDPS